MSKFQKKNKEKGAPTWSEKDPNEEELAREDANPIFALNPAIDKKKSKNTKKRKVR